MLAFFYLSCEVRRGNSHGVGRGSSQCVVQGSDHGIRRRSGIDSNDTVLPSFIEGKGYVILKSMWNSPWDSWKDVSNEDRKQLFERFEAKILGRELQPHEMWKQSHCRKGSRPLDKDLTYSSSLVSNVDLEENIEKENLVWVDDRAKETWDKNDGYLVKK
ncbi:hypothetical protein E3N88_07205 [Mikania micrantha]|uniref:Uncharacterized protein n=1 Tax=Mikania micrantha TaxID=192012 RepID=A0A5N6PTS1_9ASTR|nr:hypothetical protein E3N88_07205 [Mikania micrantha]